MLTITTLEKKNFIVTDIYVRGKSRVEAVMVFRWGSFDIESEEIADELENYNPEVGIATDRYEWGSRDMTDPVEDHYEFSDDVSEDDRNAFMEEWGGGNDSGVEGLGWEFDDGNLTVRGKLGVEDLDTGEEAEYPLKSEPTMTAEPEDFVDDEFANGLQHLKEDKQTLNRIKLLAGL